VILIVCRPISIIFIASDECLQARRRERGLSQEKLAERSDLHRTFVGDIERGKINLSLHSIHSLAIGLDLPPARLFEDP
jgi:transcriptional regulator with XRE-family HTH domain